MTITQRRRWYRARNWMLSPEMFFGVSLVVYLAAGAYALWNWN